MFPVASILHEQNEASLAWLLQVLASQGFPVAPHVWKGLTVVVDQVRMTVGSTDVVVQANDDGVCDDEIHEFVHLLGDLDRVRLERCRESFDILPFQPDATMELYDQWLTTGVSAEVPVHATLSNLDVMRLAKAIAQAVDGLIFDNVKNCFV